MDFDNINPRASAAAVAAADAEGGNAAPTPSLGVVALGDATADRRPVAALHGFQLSRQKRFGSWSIAAQFHKLCSSPTNFGPFRPINYESKSRNYARPLRSGSWIPQILTLRYPLARLFRFRSRFPDASPGRRGGCLGQFRRALWGFRIASDKPTLSDMFISRQERRITANIR